MVLRRLLLRLKVQNLLDSLTPIDVMAASDAIRESKIFQEPTQIGKADIGVGSAT
jgi:hypothetical protein